MSDDLFQFGMPQDPKASHSKKSGAKKSSNDALFAGISS
jgi:hypothetical protein